jgi:hypothetical protein
MEVVMPTHSKFPREAERHDVGTSAERDPDAILGSAHGCVSSAGSENRRDSGVKAPFSHPPFSPIWKRRTALALKASLLSHDPAFAPGVPLDRYVTRRILAARSLVDRHGRNLIGWSRLAAMLGEAEADVRRWHAAAAQIADDPAPCVGGGASGSVIGRAA